MNWYIYLIPFTCIALLTFIAAITWRNATAKILLDPDKAALPFITAISVLAIGVPLSAAFLQEVLKSSSAGWVPDLILSAMVMAILSLVVGAYVIYTLVLDAPKDDSGKITLSSETWELPTAMSCQYSSLIIFLFCIVVAMFNYSSHARNTDIIVDSKTNPILIEKPLPPLGSSRDAIISQWGQPSRSTNNSIEYRAGTATLVLSFGDSEKLSKIVYENRSDKNEK
jgi:hypothetical protein